MGILLEFLTDNYLYFAIAAGVLVLALIGYIVDSTKTEKLKKEYGRTEVENSDIPVVNITQNTKSEETVNNATTKSNDDVKEANNDNSTSIPTLEPKTSQKKENS